jgi:hypothetical protein
LDFLCWLSHAACVAAFSTSLYRKTEALSRGESFIEGIADGTAGGSGGDGASGSGDNNNRSHLGTILQQSTLTRAQVCVCVRA